MIPAPITDDIRATFAPMSDSLAKAWRTRQIYRTETEMRISVLNDGWFPSWAAKYWQCVREQCVMLEQRALESIQIERNRNKRRQLTAILLLIDGMRPDSHELDADGEFVHKLSEALHDIGVDVRPTWHCVQRLRDETQIDLDEALFAAANLESMAADRVREIKLWEKLKAEFLAADPSINTENVDAHQLISYTIQFAGRALRADVTGMSEGEQVNLAGQLMSAWRRCETMNVLDKVLQALPNNAPEQIKALLK